MATVRSIYGELGLNYVYPSLYNWSMMLYITVVLDSNEHPTNFINFRVITKDSLILEEREVKVTKIANVEDSKMNILEYVNDIIKIDSFDAKAVLEKAQKKFNLTETDLVLDHVDIIPRSR